MTRQNGSGSRFGGLSAVGDGLIRYSTAALRIELDSVHVRCPVGVEGNVLGDRVVVKVPQVRTCLFFVPAVKGVTGLCQSTRFGEFRAIGDGQILRLGLATVRLEGNGVGRRCFQQDGVA